jgi:hypothetical protein
MGQERASSPKGIAKENVAPGPSFAIAHKRPPWLSTIDRLTDRPIPMPFDFVVKNASNNFPTIFDPYTAILDVQSHLVVFVALSPDDKRARTVCYFIHCVCRIEDQV